LSTSGIYGTTLTVTQLVTDALVDLGVLDLEASPSANQLALGIRKLNHILFQLKGPTTHLTPSEKPWTREVASITPKATANYYTLAPTGGDEAIEIPTEVLALRLRHTATLTDQLLTPMTSQEYLALPDKTALSSPRRYYYEKRIASGVLYVDCYASSDVVSNYTLELDYRQPLEVVTAGTQTLDLPDWWNRAMEWLLAREMGPGFTIDDKTWQRVNALATEAMAMAGVHDLSSTIAYFQPGKEMDE
jgi:hypothetical protein